MPDKQPDSFGVEKDHIEQTTENSYGVEKLQSMDAQLGARAVMYEDMTEEHGVLKGTYLYYKQLILGE